MGSVEVAINSGELEKAVKRAERLDMPLGEAVERITANANRLSSGFRTGVIHRDGHAVGDTQPEYAGDVKRGKNGHVGLVHPANYAAMKDNYENNTLLKSV